VAAGHVAFFYDRVTVEVERRAVLDPVRSRGVPDRRRYQQTDTHRPEAEPFLTLRAARVPLTEALWSI
jgi:hypothetical protein